MENVPRYSLTSVDNALQLVQLLQSGEVLLVSSAANHLGVARSTAHRLLAMLVHHGFATRGPNREYVRGPALRDPTAVLPEGLTVAELRIRILPILRTLTNAVNETSNAQLLMGDFARVIASVECDRTLRVGNREGQNLPADKASGGRALLSTHLEEISGVWVAINDQEIEDGITAVGLEVPTRTLRKRLAVSVAMPSNRFSRRDLPTVIQHLRTTAEKMGTTLDGK